MGMVMAVAFTRHGRLHYLDPGPYRPAVGDTVLVPTDPEPEVAVCVWAPEEVAGVDGLPVCAGLAGAQDLARDERKNARKSEARHVARRLIREHGLPMKVVGVDHVESEGRTTIYFSAPHRVDFRGLVRDLTRTLSARIMLRQVNPREQARIQGGIGPCGRDLCCSTFLTEFEPVSVRMAKDQDLPVNPLRISGACGRLMCCLAYEQDVYTEFKADAPPVGSAVSTPEGDARVLAHVVPADAVVVGLSATGQRRVCPRADVCVARKQFSERREHRNGHGSGSA